MNNGWWNIHGYTLWWFNVAMENMEYNVLFSSMISEKNIFHSYVKEPDGITIVVQMQKHQTCRLKWEYDGCLPWGNHGTYIYIMYIQYRSMMMVFLKYHGWLVVSTNFLFSIIYGIILPNWLIFFKMVKTTNQMVNGMRRIWMYSTCVMWCPASDLCWFSFTFTPYVDIPHNPSETFVK